MGKIAASTGELRRLYFEEEWSLAKIAAHFNVSRQAVHDRLKRAGFALRPHGFVELDRETVERLYVKENLSVATIAKRLGVSPSTVVTSLRRHGIEMRKPGTGGYRRYPELLKLKVGESVTVPRPDRRRNWHVNFYKMAKHARIRLSIRTIDDSTVRLTRVE